MSGSPRLASLPPSLQRSPAFAHILLPSFDCLLFSDPLTHITSPQPRPLPASPAAPTHILTPTLFPTLPYKACIRPLLPLSSLQNANLPAALTRLLPPSSSLLSFPSLRPFLPSSPSRPFNPAPPLSPPPSFPPLYNQCSSSSTSERALSPPPSTRLRTLRCR